VLKVVLLSSLETLLLTGESSVLESGWRSDVECDLDAVPDRIGAVPEPLGKYPPVGSPLRVGKLGVGSPITGETSVLLECGARPYEIESCGPVAVPVNNGAALEPLGKKPDPVGYAVPAAAIAVTGQIVVVTELREVTVTTRPDL
jgi:hypothetical protein